MANALVTRAEYKAYTGITSSTQDVVIDSLVVKISDLVTTICKRNFLSEIGSVTDVLDGGQNFLVPSESPIVSIISVEASNDYGLTYSTLVEFSDWVFNKNEQVIKTPYSSGFIEKLNGYRVTYNAGYDSTPTELKLAVFDIITYYIRSDSAVHSTKQVSPNTMQVEYLKDSSFPAHIKRILDLYTANYN